MEVLEKEQMTVPFKLNGFLVIKQRMLHKTMLCIFITLLLNKLLLIVYYYGIITEHLFITQ